MSDQEENQEEQGQDEQEQQEEEQPQEEQPQEAQAEGEGEAEEEQPKEEPKEEPAEEAPAVDLPEDQHVIIDNGSGLIKAGFSGEDSPRCVFPTILGRPKHKGGGMLGIEKKTEYVGLHAEEKRGILTLSYPIKEGIVENWDDMSKIWEHVFANELRVASEEKCVMLTESPMNPKSNREKMVEIMMETFNVQGVYIAIQAVLSLYAAGKFTGCVCDIGDGATNVVPIYDGFSLPHSIVRMSIAGRPITSYLQKLLKEIKINLVSSSEFEICRDIKEKCCYVALNFEEEAKTFEPMEYEMPDGKKVVIKDQRYRAPEALFKPSLVGSENGGIHKIVFESINKSDLDIRKDLYESIVMSGGSSMFKGLPERLEKEMIDLVPQAMKNVIKVNASPERKYCVWLGGSLLASIPSFNSNWITRQDYKESGAQIVHTKCK